MIEAASRIACAARRLATRIFSMISGDITSPPVCGAGCGLPTYSGRSMDAGTSSRGEMSYGVNRVTSASVFRRSMGHDVDETKVRSPERRTSEGVAMAEEYYYCLEHNTVETKDGCREADRL